MKSMRDVDMGRPIDSELMKLPNATMISSDESFASEKDIAVTNINLKEIPFSSQTAKDMLSIRNLSLTTPDRKRTLISNLDLTIQAGSSLLIVGNSGK